ncbi:MAG: elongation factor 1-beta [Nanoarchaeota archaeon]|nr:elongation factor 1-beta [Nanoarchaeota archaeon]
MGITLIRMKIMPTSPDVDLEQIKEKTREIIKKNKGERIVFEEEPVAFGLKAIIVNFEQEESDNAEIEPIESEMNKLLNVNSVETLDMRRAFG